MLFRIDMDGEQFPFADADDVRSFFADANALDSNHAARWRRKIVDALLELVEQPSGGAKPRTARRTR